MTDPLSPQDSDDEAVSPAPHNSYEAPTAEQPAIGRLTALAGYASTAANGTHVPPTSHAEAPADAHGQSNVAVLSREAPTVDAPVVVEDRQPVPDVGAKGGFLDARAVSAWFGTNKVLDRVSLSMPPGTVTALIGPSGCGKSTFLRILNRMHELVGSAQLAGEVMLDGEDIYAAGRRITETRKRIGMVFQKPNPFPAMSIGENVLAGLKLTGSKAPRGDKDDLIEQCLRRGGLWNEVKDRLDQPGGGLSGGQQQRLCIARSLAVQPDVLLMDEPCSALDPTSTRRVEETIHELRYDVTIVIVTHNMQQAARVSQQCAFFLAEAGTPGQIVEAGETTQIFGSPVDPRTDAYVNGKFG